MGTKRTASDGARRSVEKEPKQIGYVRHNLQVTKMVQS